jgi:TIR domain
MAASSSAARGRVFISYRRGETAYPAGWLFDRLAERFGDDQVFKDVDSIELGDDFVEVITAAVGACDVLLALIGDQWLTMTGEDGSPRIQDPDDFVRLEIEAALARNVRVIPVLVDGATMPHADELPPSIASLARRQALELSPSRFHSDTDRLLEMLDKTLAEVHATRQPTASEQRERLGADGVAATGPAALPGKRRPRVSRRTLVLAGIGAGVLVLIPLLIVVFVSASGGDSQAAPSKTVIFQDQFSNRSSGWNDDPGERDGGHYVSGAYRLYSKWNPDHWSESGFPRQAAAVYPTAPRDVRVSVVARRLVGGPGLGYGIVCRAAGHTSYYQFVIWHDQVAIAKLVGDSYDELGTGNLSAVRAKGRNSMQAVCTTDGAGQVRLAFQVNGTTAAIGIDKGGDTGPPLLTGAVGLVVANGEDSKAIEAEFDDFVVTKA